MIIEDFIEDGYNNYNLGVSDNNNISFLSTKFKNIST